MTLDAIDEALAAWEDRLRLSDDSLIALESDPAYQTLAAAAKRGAIEGETAAVGKPALDAITDLFAARQLLGDVMARAKALRASVGFWDKDEKIARLHELLDGPSITIGAELTPLSKRDLLGVPGHEVTIAPEKLLEQMAAGFAGARDAIFAIGKTSARLEAELEGALAEIEVLFALAPEGGDARRSLAALKGEVKALKARAARDPLGAAASFDAGAASKLHAIRAQLADESESEARVRRSLDEARALVREAAAKNTAAQLARADALRTIEAAWSVEPVDSALVGGLEPWLEKLTRTVLAGRIGAAEIGLARLVEFARAYVEQDEAAEVEARGALGERDELEGRLSARRAQLAAMRARGADVDRRWDARLADAEALLSRRPCPLDEARVAVRSIDDAFNQR